MIYKVKRTKLGGEVQVQGSKNSAMKQVIVPFIYTDVTVVKNVPNISSIHNLLELMKLAGVQVKWLNKHSVEIDTTGKLVNRIIPEELFFHTSAGGLLVPLWVNRFGECVIENKSGREDTGGDAIGRKMEFKWYEVAGIGAEKTTDRYRFWLKDKKPFKADAGKGFGPSVIMVFAALGEDGVSEIENICPLPEMRDIFIMLKKMGVKIDQKVDKLLINRNNGLRGCEHENMDDRHDLATWVAMALATESELAIKTKDTEKLQLGGLRDFLDKLGVRYVVEKTEVRILKNKLVDLKPVEVVASYETGFASEWQVLFSPVLALIPGESKVVDMQHADRMGHWEEFGKLGAKYKLLSKREVKITGGVKLMGAEVVGKDVRATAALIIAGLAANGETVVVDEKNNLERGYERLWERVKLLQSRS